MGQIIRVFFLFLTKVTMYLLDVQMCGWFGAVASLGRSMTWYLSSGLGTELDTGDRVCSRSRNSVVT